MSRVATVVPDESDLLCEGCGYTLNGLPTSGNCPECGKPISASLGTHRNLSQVESHGGLGGFIQTTWAVLWRPKRFFRRLTTRTQSKPARRFATVHLILATGLFGFAALGHLNWIMDISSQRWIKLYGFIMSTMPVSVALLFFTLLGLKKLAAWLSAIEAKYWGMRLPYSVVLRGLDFHTAHYLPVGILAVAIVWGYRVLLECQIVSHRYDANYLYTLCGMVILSAIYLFQTYWIAMKAMMWANR
jgi:hypothetical protein